LRSTIDGPSSPWQIGGLGVGTIIKPSVGLSPGETAALVRQLTEGGIDLIKDDELQI
jgi:ribulose 1,5-bisphosphate carboxylase large subunit-like protein